MTQAAATASFQVTVLPEAMRAFAELSGDHNPLHTNAEHARTTEFGRPVLHGAYSAGLLSRLAGMYLPGTDCLLSTMQLRFIAPIRPPVVLQVHGELRSTGSGHGRVEATITDAQTGLRYVDGAYEFGRHRVVDAAAPVTATRPQDAVAKDVVLVTGAGGGLGRAVASRLGGKAVAVAHAPKPGTASAEDLDALAIALEGRSVSAVVHCGWPAPDNARLIDIQDAGPSVDYSVAAPLRQTIALAKAMVRFGQPNALLVLVGSTAALPGRHAYRAPLYTLGKTLVPELARILAVELASAGMRSAAVVFDVIEAGMNAHLAPRARLAHVDRSPAGRLPNADEAAAQISWVLENKSFLVSGATITLAGGALP